MSVLITIDSISRRPELDTFPRPVYFKPWRMDGKKRWTLDTISVKAAAAFKSREGATGAAYLNLYDTPRFVVYGGVSVLLMVGCVRVKRGGRYTMSRDISGVVEIRISGLDAENFDLSTVGDVTNE